MTIQMLVSTVHSNAVKTFQRNNVSKFQENETVRFKTKKNWFRYVYTLAYFETRRALVCQNSCKVTYHMMYIHYFKIKGVQSMLNRETLLS